MARSRGRFSLAKPLELALTARHHVLRCCCITIVLGYEKINGKTKGTGTEN